MLKQMYWKVTATWHNWRFRRAFERAPVKKLGPDTFVKEVWGNLYVVDKPMDDARQECGCFQCTGHGTR